MTDYVTWPQLLEWAKAHGAVNDSITGISIGTTVVDGEVYGVVTMHGHEYNEQGRPFVVSDEESLHRAARWEVTKRLLRWLP